MPVEVRYLFLDGQNHKVRTEFGVTDRQMLAAFAILPDGTERLLGYRLASSQSEDEWALPVDDLKARGPWRRHDWILTEERAVRCLAEKIDRCLTFYDEDHPWPNGTEARSNSRGRRPSRSRSR